MLQCYVTAVAKLASVFVTGQNMLLDSRSSTSRWVGLNIFKFLNVFSKEKKNKNCTVEFFKLNAFLYE